MIAQQEKKSRKFWHEDAWPKKKRQTSKEANWFIQNHGAGMFKHHESLETAFLAGVHAFLSRDMETLEECFHTYAHDLYRFAGNDAEKRKQMIRLLWKLYENPLGVEPEQVVHIQTEVIEEKVPIPVDNWPKRRIWQVKKSLSRTKIIYSPPPQPRLQLAQVNVDAHATVAAQKVTPALLDAVGQAVADATATSGRNTDFVHRKTVEAMIHQLAESIGCGARLFHLNEIPKETELPGAA